MNKGYRHWTKCVFRFIDCSSIMPKSSFSWLECVSELMARSNELEAAPSWGVASSDYATFLIHF